jgi:hypothetical protein
VFARLAMLLRAATMVFAAVPHQRDMPPPDPPRKEGRCDVAASGPMGRRVRAGRNLNGKPCTEGGGHRGAFRRAALGCRWAATGGKVLWHRFEYALTRAVNEAQRLIYTFRRHAGTGWQEGERVDLRHDNLRRLSGASSGNFAGKLWRRPVRTGPWLKRLTRTGVEAHRRRR